MLDNTYREYLVDVSEIPCDAIYNYRVRAFRSSNGLGSDPTNLVYIYNPCELAEPPTNVSGVATSQTEIELTWTPSTTLTAISSVSGTGTEYIEVALPVEVERYDSNEARWIVISQHNYDMSLLVSGFECEQTEQFRLRVNWHPHYSRYTDAISVILPSCPLFTPSDFVAEEGIYNDIILSWTDSNLYETNYIVERSLNSGWEILADLPADSTTYTDTTPLPDSYYTYRVRAYRSTIDTYSDYASIAIQTPKERQLGPEFMVTSTGDSPYCYVGNCTFRGALSAINLYQTAGTIKFNLPGNAPHRIILVHELPIIGISGYD